MKITDYSYRYIRQAGMNYAEMAKDDSNYADCDEAWQDFCVAEDRRLARNSAELCKLAACIHVYGADEAAALFADCADLDELLHLLRVAPQHFEELALYPEDVALANAEAHLRGEDVPFHD